MSLLVLFSTAGVADATVVAPVGVATASVVAPAVGAPVTLVVPACSVRASRATALMPLDTKLPTDSLAPEAYAGVPVVTGVTAVAALTAASSAPVVRVTPVSVASAATATRTAPGIVTTVTVPARVTTAAVAGGVPLVMPLATPAANVRAEQFRLLSPTGQAEPPYAHVTMRQVV